MNCSRIFLFCCLVLAAACTRRIAVEQDVSLASYGTVQGLVATHGQISGQFETRYVHYLNERLLGALSPVEAQSARTQIVLLGDATPMAGTPGSGFIVMSQGLIRRLHNEGELAFVLAHEMAHQILGHSYSTELDLEDRQERELEADRRAVAMIALAGYDPRVSVGALLHSAGSDAFSSNSSANDGYPQVQQRIQAVRTLVLESHWKPPGTIDRHDFQKLRRNLSTLN